MQHIYVISIIEVKGTDMMHIINLVAFINSYN